MYDSIVTLPARTHIFAAALVLALVIALLTKVTAPAPYKSATIQTASSEDAALPPVTPLVFDTGPVSAPTQTSAAALAAVPMHIFNFSPPVKEHDGNAELFAYGNALGALVQTFSNEHLNLTDILSAHAQARTDARAVAALAALAGDYEKLGDGIALVATPPVAAALGTSLAESYRAIGMHLRAIAASSDDASFLAAIQAQNKSAHTLVQTLALLSALFKASGVRFSATDAGYLFVGDSGT